jgi:hypothetical protein
LRAVYADSFGGNGSVSSDPSRKPVEWVIPVLTEFKQDLSSEEEAEENVEF